MNLENLVKEEKTVLQKRVNKIISKKDKEAAVIFLTALIESDAEDLKNSENYKLELYANIIAKTQLIRELISS